MRLDFLPVPDDTDVAIYGVEAAGKGLVVAFMQRHLPAGTPGILHGNRTYLFAK